MFILKLRKLLLDYICCFREYFFKKISFVLGTFRLLKAKESALGKKNDTLHEFFPVS